MCEPCPAASDAECSHYFSPDVGARVTALLEAAQTARHLLPTPRRRPFRACPCAPRRLAVAAMLDAATSRRHCQVAIFRHRPSPSFSLPIAAAAAACRHFHYAPRFSFTAACLFFFRRCRCRPSRFFRHMPCRFPLFFAALSAMPILLFRFTPSFATFQHAAALQEREEAEKRCRKNECSAGKEAVTPPPIFAGVFPMLMRRRPRPLPPLPPCHCAACAAFMPPLLLMPSRRR